MNRTQRAKIKAAHKKVEMNRAFKNDAIESRNLYHRSFFESNSNSRFENENDIFKSSQKELRRLKKYNGPTGSMSENNYMELIGA